MAKTINIELEKTVSDIISKNFKLGVPGEKVASSITNGLFNKMIFGSDEERKNLLLMLVPDVVSSQDALKIYNNISKYKEKEKEQLLGLFEEKTTTKTSKQNKEEKETQQKEVHKAVAVDEDL